MLACLMMTAVLAAPAPAAWDEGKPIGDDGQEAEPEPPTPVITRRELDWRMKRQRLSIGVGLSAAALLTGGLLLGLTPVVFGTTTSCNGDSCSSGGSGMLITGATLAAGGGLLTLIYVPLAVRHNKRKPPEMAVGPGRFALRF